MTEANSDPITGLASGLRNGIILAIFALISTGLTSITWMVTKEQIQTEKELALLRAISEIVPAELYSNDPYRDCILLTDRNLLGSNDALPAWRLRDKDGLPVAVLISSVAPNGYSGAIEMIVGHYSSSNKNSQKTAGTLAGVRVSSHKETPGLGDKVETRKSDWILQFAGLDSGSLKSNVLKVKKDGGQFDAFTGATITPRAVLAAIDKNIQYFKNNEQMLFSKPANCEVVKADE